MIYLSFFLRVIYNSGYYPVSFYKFSWVLCVTRMTKLKPVQMYNPLLQKWFIKIPQLGAAIYRDENSVCFYLKHKDKLWSLTISKYVRWYWQRVVNVLVDFSLLLFNSVNYFIQFSTWNLLLFQMYMVHLCNFSHHHILSFHLTNMVHSLLHPTLGAI